MTTIGRVVILVAALAAWALPRPATSRPSIRPTARRRSASSRSTRTLPGRRSPKAASRRTWARRPARRRRGIRQLRRVARLLPGGPRQPELAARRRRGRPLRAHREGDLHARGGGGGFRFHPYPINPFHADYLAPLRLGGRGAKSLRPALGRRRRRPEGAGDRLRSPNRSWRRVGRLSAQAWDVEIEEVALDRPDRREPL